MDPVRKGRSAAGRNPVQKEAETPGRPAGVSIKAINGVDRMTSRQRLEKLSLSGLLAKPLRKGSVSERGTRDRCALSHLVQEASPGEPSDGGEGEPGAGSPPLRASEETWPLKQPPPGKWRDFPSPGRVPEPGPRAGRFIRGRQKTGWAVASFL